MYLKTFRRLVPAMLLAIILAQPAILKAEEETGLSGSLGVAVAAIPEFEGSNRYKAWIQPVADLSYGPVFLSTGRGLGVNLVSAPGWTVAPAVRYRWARKERDSDLLKGLGDIDGGAEVGGVISWKPGSAGLSLKVFQGLGQVDGLTVELEANYGTTLTDCLQGSVSLSAMFADQDYHQRYFGLTPEQSRLSGYRVYEPDSGLKHVALTGTLSYDLTERISLGLMAEYKRLAGPAADSPLVERGSANQFISAFSASFNF